MSFGVTSSGFVTKRLADIKSEMESAARATFGPAINLDAESPVGQLVGIMSEREALLWEVAEGVYNSGYPATAEGVPLDNVVALLGIKRKAATFSTVTATLLGTVGTVIPQGSILSVSGNSAARFKLNAAATIAAAVVEVQKIAFDHVPTGGGPWKITWNGLQTGTIAYNAVAATVQIALRLLAGLSAATVTGDYTAGFTVTFTGTVGDQPQLTITGTTLTYASGNVTPTVSTLTGGLPEQVTAAFTAEVSGAVQAPAASLTVIETAVSGWASATNALDAVVGSAIESDADLKLRRAASIQKSGTGTLEAIRADILQLPNVKACLIFENDTTATVSSRPAKSFEAIVLGGIDADVALTIWQDKPAGIQAYGTTIVSITDSQGFAHDIGFSRPTEVDISVEIDLTTTADYPTGGNALVQAAIVAYGAGLSIGDDVIVYPSLMASIALIPGIIDVALRVGTAPGPTLDNNIVIAATARAAFDTSRVLVTIL